MKYKIIVRDTLVECEDDPIKVRDLMFKNKTPLSIMRSLFRRVNFFIASFFLIVGCVFLLRSAVLKGLFDLHVKDFYDARKNYRI